MTRRGFLSVSCLRLYRSIRKADFGTQFLYASYEGVFSEGHNILGSVRLSGRSLSIEGLRMLRWFFLAAELVVA